MGKVQKQNECFHKHGGITFQVFLASFISYTGHHSPLFRRDEADHETHPAYGYNVYYAIQLYLELGTDPNKMVLGMPTYGRGHRLVNNDESGLYCYTDGGVDPGPFTAQEGILGYNEILMLLNGIDNFLPDATPGQWEITVDDCYMAPYATNGPYWISYDDEESVAYKMRYANLLGLRGAMFWSLDTDDFRGIYKPGSNTTYPLIRRVIEEMNGGLTYDPNKDCGSAPMCDNPLVTPPPNLNNLD